MFCRRCRRRGSNPTVFFENIEHLFDIYEAPADLRSKLLIPHLCERAKSLVGRLDAKSLDNYEEMKRFLLGEFKVTAMEYKTTFDKASKRVCLSFA